ncbi:VPA1267 family protein [Pseudomonas [fluorescens] ATCC 17400]
MSDPPRQSDRTYALFTEWASAKSDDDFRSIIHRGVLSRTQIALDCGFALSVLRSNPRIKRALSELEDVLRAREILPLLSPSDPEPQALTETSPDYQLHAQSSGLDEAASTNRSASATATHGARGDDLTKAAIQRLQTENASQRAEIAELRKRLQKYESLHSALSSTGRLPR